MEKNVQKANRILYVVIIAVLCVTAVVIGITASANRNRKDPIDTSDPGTNPPIVTDSTPSDTTPPVTDPPAPVVGVLPEFVSPAVGVVAKGHDTTVAVYSLTMNDWRIHTGIDIACALSDEVVAAADGVVRSVVSDPMMGTTVILDHEGEGVTIYRNLATVLPEGIKAGASVKQGQVIAAVGDTAMIEGADEPHLHFEMQIKGVSVNPLDHITKESQEACLGADKEFES